MKHILNSKKLCLTVLVGAVAMYGLAMMVGFGPASVVRPIQHLVEFIGVASALLSFVASLWVIYVFTRKSA